MDSALRQTLVNTYFRDRAPRYAHDAETGVWGYWKRRELSAVRDHLGDLYGLDVLECGCGAGWYARRLIEQQPASYIATDFLPEMLQEVRIPGVTPMQADLTSFTLEIMFDRILCAGALEFVPLPELFFSRAATVLRENGRIVLLVPPDNFPGRLYRLWHRCHGFRIHLFGMDFLTRNAANVGLHILRSTRATAYSTVVTLGRR
jgi:SAM-dependent methyltransferase